MKVRVLLRTPFRAEDRELHYTPYIPSRSHLARFSVVRRVIFHQDIAQPGRARARGARGHGIEARFPDHFGEAELLHVLSSR